MRVKELMSEALSWVNPQTCIEDVAKMMKEEDVGAVLVCNEEKELLGIVTDRDIVLKYLASPCTQENAVETIMSKDVICIGPEFSVHEAGELLSSGKIRRLPVVKNRKLVGIIGISDIAKRNIYTMEAGETIQKITR